MLNVTDLGEGTPILWIHGFPLSADVYESQLGMHGVRHIIPDLPGFGQSRANVGEMTIDDYARIALDLLDHRGLDQAIFAGLSMGGYVCLAAARLAPRRLRGLILIDTRETPDTPEAKKGRYESIEKVRKANSVEPVVEAMLPKMLSADAPKEAVARVREIMMTSSVDGVVAALGAMAERPDSTSVLPAIKVPTLVVVGEHDTITPPADAERMASAIPHARLVRIRNAGHLSNFEQPDEFNKVVSSFVQALK